MPSKLSIILDLHYDQPNKYRFNCPFCGRVNSLSISEDGGHVKYKCFGATCNTRGIHHEKLSIENIKANRLVVPNSIPISNFVVPDYFVSALDRASCKDYLVNNHCLGAVVQDRIQVKYDPKQDRIVFLTYDLLGNIVGANGRKLNYKADGPKWLVYGSYNYPFVAGNKDVAIVVEDCASASSVSHLLTGVALCGTNINTNHLSILRKYKKIMIALDQDAVRKACELEASIRFFASTSILLLNEDIKALDHKHLYEMLGRHIQLDKVEDL